MPKKAELEKWTDLYTNFVLCANATSSTPLSKVAQCRHGSSPVYTGIVGDGSSTTRSYQAYPTDIYGIDQDPFNRFQYTIGYLSAN